MDFENFSGGEGVSHEPLDGFGWLYRQILSIPSGLSAGTIRCT
jgi:hypothetical protein